MRSFVPTGLFLYLTIFPNLESLGYSRTNSNIELRTSFATTDREYFSTNRRRGHAVLCAERHPSGRDLVFVDRGGSSRSDLPLAVGTNALAADHHALDLD